MKKYEVEVDAVKIDARGECQRVAAARLRREGGWQLVAAVVDGYDKMLHHLYWSREADDRSASSAGPEIARPRA